jgi:hypothetical protein
VATDSERNAGTAASPLERRLMALAVLAAWSIVPPYLGPVVGLELDVSSTVEVVDHVIPGLCAVAAACIALFDARHGQTDSVRALAALGVCVLAGLFQAVSHATLVLNAGGPQQPVGAVVLHATPGPALLLFALWLLLRSQPEDHAV